LKIWNGNLKTAFDMLCAADVDARTTGFYYL
jgi:hypothetical protein